MRSFLFLSCLLMSAMVLAQKPKVVLIIADGIPADVIERLQPPAIQKVISKGFYTRAYVGGIAGTYKETPTISAPGYTDMLTGTWAYKHNVWDNGNQHPNYNYPTIFRILKTVQPQSKTAIFSTWLDNRTVLLGAGLPQTGNLKVDYVFDGFEKNTIMFPHDSNAMYLHNIDEHVVHCADSVIREKAPDLSWIYLEYTDDVGHAKGTGAAFDSAIGLLDKQIAKIDAAIEYREANFNEKWLLVLTTDHGRDSITGSGHGDQSRRERTTWIVMNKATTTNEYLKTADPGIVDILPSVANFMHINIPVKTKQELDGVPLLGPVSISNAMMTTKDGLVHLSWKSFAPKEKVKILITYTNNAKAGKEDIYKLVGTVDSGKEFFDYTLPLRYAPFYKIVLQGEHNTLNVQFTQLLK